MYFHYLILIMEKSILWGCGNIAKILIKMTQTELITFALFGFCFSPSWTIFILTEQICFLGVWGLRHRYYLCFRKHEPRPMNG
jgi:hypothetical protein